MRIFHASQSSDDGLQRNSGMEATSDDSTNQTSQPNGFVLPARRVLPDAGALALAGSRPKFIKIGGRVKYRLSDIEEFEQSRLCQSTADQYYFDSAA